MKKTFFLVITIAAILASCSSNESASVGSVTTAASATITAYVTDNYPGTTVYTSTASGSKVITTLNTGEQLTFTSAGTIISYANNISKGLKADSLIITPDSTFIDGKGKPGQGKGHGGPDGRGGMMGGGPGSKGHDGPGYGGPIDSTHVAGAQKPGHDRHFKNEIVVDSLPSVINAYVLANYATYTVIHAEIDTICQGAVTEVMVCIKGTEPVKLVFDATGSYLFKAKRILYADVPAAVTATITANYPTYKATHRVELFTLANGSLQYKVFLILNKTHKVVTFNADGTVACEK